MGNETKTRETPDALRAPTAGQVAQYEMLCRHLARCHRHDPACRGLDELVAGAAVLSLRMIAEHCDRAVADAIRYTAERTCPEHLASTVSDLVDHLLFPR
jgi:hypothetical protein